MSPTRSLQYSGSSTWSSGLSVASTASISLATSFALSRDERRDLSPILDEEGEATEEEQEEEEAEADSQEAELGLVLESPGSKRRGSAPAIITKSPDTSPEKLPDGFALPAEV